MKITLLILKESVKITTKNDNAKESLKIIHNKNYPKESSKMKKKKKNKVEKKRRLTSAVILFNNSITSLLFFSTFLTVLYVT